jgi:hypothetical protein
MMYLLYPVISSYILLYVFAINTLTHFTQSLKRNPPEIPIIDFWYINFGETRRLKGDPHNSSCHLHYFSFSFKILPSQLFASQLVTSSDKFVWDIPALQCRRLHGPIAYWIAAKPWEKENKNKKKKKKRKWNCPRLLVIMISVTSVTPHVWEFYHSLAKIFSSDWMGQFQFFFLIVQVKYKEVWNEYRVPKGPRGSQLG